MGDLIVIFLLIVCFALAIRTLWKDRKKGGCCGNCSQCKNCQH